MTRFNFPGKPRKEGSLHNFFTIDGKEIVVGPNLLRNSDVKEARAKTEARACFRACRTCGTCANSRRDATWPYEFDGDKKVDCRACEPFRFHDCHNGKFRDSYGEGEPFTDEVLKMMDDNNGKPLI